jgi:hypothetical protein
VLRLAQIIIWCVRFSLLRLLREVRIVKDRHDKSNVAEIITNNYHGKSNVATDLGVFLLFERQDVGNYEQGRTQ